MMFTWTDLDGRVHVETCAGSKIGCEGCGQPDPADTPLLAGLRTGDWLDAQTFPALTYAVPGIIPEGMTLLVGPPKIGKSWLVLGLALAVAAGGRALSVIDVGHPRPVLYLALEDGDRRLQDRCRRLLAPGEPIPGRLEYLTQPAGTVPAVIDAWLDCHPGTAPLIILDTLGKVLPPALVGETTYQRDYRIGGQLKALCDARPGVSLVINHHDRKASSDDFVDAVSGTHGLAGAADQVVVLVRPRLENAGLVKITGRDVPEGEYGLTFDAGLWALDGDDLATAAATARTVRATAGLGDRSAEVVALVARHPGGVRAADVAAALDLDPHLVRNLLARLYDANRVGRITRGVYGSPGASGASGAFSPSGAGTRRTTRTTCTSPCTVCGFPVSEDGATTHAVCDPEGSDE